MEFQMQLEKQELISEQMEEIMDVDDDEDEDEEVDRIIDNIEFKLGGGKEKQKNGNETFD